MIDMVIIKRSLLIAINFTIFAYVIDQIIWSIRVALYWNKKHKNDRISKKPSGKQMVDEYFSDMNNKETK